MKLPPLMAYYKEIQETYPDYIICIEIGSFYEILEIGGVGYAQKAAKLGDLTLTSKNKKDKNAPLMAGFPNHTADTYFKKLVDAGETVVVVSQKNEDKKITRYIEKILSPGTTVDNLTDSISNYYACIFEENGGVGLAYIEISTGEVKVTELLKSELDDLLDIIKPTEILICGDIELSKSFKVVHKQDKVSIRKLSSCGSIFSHIYEMDNPTSNPSLHISTLNLERWRLATLALGNLIDYISSTDYNELLLKKLDKPKVYHKNNYLNIPMNGYKSLEILDSQSPNGQSLLDCLDDCSTALGRRKLRQYLINPLISPSEINNRLDKVEKFKKIQYPELKNIYDLLRIQRRINLRRAVSIEIGHLYQSLNSCKTILKKEKSQNLKKVQSLLTYLEHRINFEEIHSKLYLFFKNDLFESISTEFNSWKKRTQELDLVLIGLNQKLNTTKLRVEKRLGSIKLIGPKSLSSETVKIIKKTNSTEIIDSDWLKAAEALFSAEQKLMLKSQEVWVEFQSDLVDKFSSAIYSISDEISEVDVLSNFGRLAVKYDYCRPKFIEQDHVSFDFNNIRHPIIEMSKTLTKGYVPNSVRLDKDNSIMCLYGANSSGKSTLLKSVAINIVMAQIGCFVPSSSAILTPFSHILTRMTTFDSLADGLSTFTMEMTELQKSLNFRKDKSLFLLDEIGRGTSVDEGEAIAFSTIDYIAQPDTNAVTFFATHYHKLADNVDKIENLVIYHFNCFINSDGTLFFDRELVKGPGDGSYGIAVAKSCGLPEQIIRLAVNYKKKYGKLISSRYNKQIEGIICPICNYNRLTETHHKIEQKQGTVKSITVDGVKKSINDKDNLILVCSNCHDKITRGEILVDYRSHKIKK